MFHYTEANMTRFTGPEPEDYETEVRIIPTWEEVFEPGLKPELRFVYCALKLLQVSALWIGLGALIVAVFSYFDIQNTALNIFLCGPFGWVIALFMK